MGLDPEDSEFEAGGSCLTCEGSLFGGVTPKYVWANFNGVHACPPYAGPVPKGSYKLTQDPLNSCRWLSEGGTMNFYWLIVPTSNLVALQNVGFFPVLFRSDHVGVCLDTFSNQCGCGIPPFFCSCSGGTGTISWGPDIPCGE